MPYASFVPLNYNASYCSHPLMKENKAFIWLENNYRNTLFVKDNRSEYFRWLEKIDRNIVSNPVFNENR